MDALLTALAVIAAATYLVRRVYKANRKPKSDGCGCGAESCSAQSGGANRQTE